MEPGLEVPFNTVLADLDAGLRALLERALGTVGFGGVRIAFDAPTREWAAGVSAPTLNLFLYDLRQSEDAQAGELAEERSNGQAIRRRPALLVDCAYSITAWANAVQDEHRMLSQTLVVLLANARLPDSTLGDGAMVAGGIRTSVGRPKRDGAAEFWAALGGQYKVALDYVVTVAFDPGVQFHRGPPAQSQQVRVKELGAPRPATTELHRTGGVVRDAAGRPAAGAWLALPEVGAFASAGDDGRFVFTRVPAGRHRCECRTAGGLVATTEVVVPGGGLELTLPTRE